MRNTTLKEECVALSVGDKPIKFVAPTKPTENTDTGQRQTNNQTRLSIDKAALIQITMSVVANFSALSSGMGLGFPAITLGALTRATDPMSLDTDQASWFASINAIACPFGGLISAYILDKFGRKMTLVVINVTAIISWGMMALASSTDFDLMYLQLLVARTIIGLTTGLTSSPPAIYSAEIASSKLRGRLAMLTSMSIAVGILFIYLLGYLIPDNWRLVSAISCSVPVIALALLLALPESPSWLLSQGRQTDAEQSLMKLRGVCNRTEIATEFQEMAQRISNRNTRREESTWDVLRQPEVYKPLTIMISFFAFQQFSGIFVIIVYAAKFVRETGGSFDPLLCTVLIGVVRIVATICVGLLLETAGRKPPTIFSGIGMTVCMFGLAAYIKFPATTVNVDWVPVLLILSFIFTSTMGFLTLPFTMLAEMFPQKVRGLASGITIFSAYSMSFVCIKLYPKMVDLMGMDNVVIFFGMVSFIGIFYVWFVLPETKGKSLQEIEDYFKRGSTTNSSHVERENLRV